MKKCDFNCFLRDQSFDTIINNETNFNLYLKDITHSNIRWFLDKTIIDDTIQIREWSLNNKNNLYILWLKEDYCDIHNVFLMKCLYIGKGELSKRIVNHFKSKDFSDEMLIYFTSFRTENRKSKYIEQLLLDIYKTPFNKKENGGQKILYEYFTQNEVD